MTRFHGMAVVAMSRHSGSPSARGNAIEMGLVPKKAWWPPWGAAMESECVKAMPIKPCRAAARLYRPTAPQCEELLTPTAAMPASRARSIASALAR
ncbi:hypothetical protein D3C78_1511450 [compost metagenome]